MNSVPNARFSVSSSVIAAKESGDLCGFVRAWRTSDSRTPAPVLRQVLVADRHGALRDKRVTLAVR